MTYDIIILGGGAAGFFTAINCAECYPNLRIAIIEKGANVLTKVKVSGGGRCNVTHAEFLPKPLTKYYPRGEKELLGPFHKFMTGDTMQWFEDRGVPLKIEEDGRVFPESNTSQTIIDCFLRLVENLNIQVFKSQIVKAINREDDFWSVTTNKEEFKAEKLVIATGSNVNMWKLIAKLGHTIINPVPSLFTFKIADSRISTIPGIVVKNAVVRVLGTSLESSGPLLITHSGMSAPAILKLSAYGAIQLAEFNYKFSIQVNFVDMSYEEVLSTFLFLKQDSPKKTVQNTTIFNIPKRLWQQLVLAANISKELRWADTKKVDLENLCNQLTKAVFKVTGKSAFKEEFVTAGGVDLKEINFKTFQSKLYNTLYFSGEVLNIDAVTGGFNFQNAWTGAYLIAQSIYAK